MRENVKLVLMIVLLTTGVVLLIENARYFGGSFIDEWEGLTRAFAGIALFGIGAMLFWNKVRPKQR
jgi:hypothetical protein